MSNVEDVSDDELFHEAISDEETTHEAVAEQQIEQPEQARDEAGRFASEQGETAEVEAADEKPVVDDNAAQVPSWRVREIREERDALRQQLEEARRQPTEPARTQVQAQQPQRAERPDPLLDPDGYAKHVRDEIRQELLHDRRESSLQAAAEAHPEEFAEAYKAAQQRIDPALKARMQESRDPGKTLLEWHREAKVKQEVGNDPNAWLEKKLEERLKDPAFLAKAAELARGNAQPQLNGGRPRVELPPSLNGASRSNATLRSNSAEPSDEQLFEELAG